MRSYYSPPQYPHAAASVRRFTRQPPYPSAVSPDRRSTRPPCLTDPYILTVLLTLIWIGLAIVAIGVEFVVTSFIFLFVGVAALVAALLAALTIGAPHPNRRFRAARAVAPRAAAPQPGATLQRAWRPFAH